MAIDDLLDEHEQSERVLAWLRSNGAGLIGGVILGLALIIGWQWWDRRQTSAAMQAGNDYQAMLDSLQAKDIAKAQSQAASLGETPYAPLAALDLAGIKVIHVENPPPGIDSVPYESLAATPVTGAVAESVAAASRSANAPAIWNAKSEESTLCALPSYRVTRMSTTG